MLNFTLASLTLISLNSASPFFAIYNNGNAPIGTKMDNCKFFKSLNPVLYSSTSFHSTLLSNSFFNQMLKGAIRFNSDSDDCQNLIKEDFVSTERYSVTDSSQQCHNLIILRCSFVNITNGNSPGGAIYCEQKIDAIIHDSQFINCFVSTENCGGAVYIVQKAVGGSTDFNDDMAIQLSIQYCCFDRIYSAKYGVCVYSAAKNTTLYFASSVNCASEPDYKIVGAQYDLQANSINSEYVNITRSKAQYCAGIEYRRASAGVFQQQTFTEMYCAFGTSFTNMGNGLNITIQNCNFFNNTVQRHLSATNTILPALVHVKADNIELTSFYFIKNIYNDGATFVGYEAGQTGTFMIKLTNCYADCNTLLPSDHVSYTSCIFNTDSKTTMEMDQLNLGNCQGFKTPPPLIIASSEFSESAYFSYSNSFTRSFTFSKSNSFSSSHKFTRSDVFDATNHFSSSHDFTKSRSFTPSFKFTKSNSFTPSFKFTKSNSFTKSNTFTKSATFTKSNTFSQSEDFTKSNVFTRSNNFDQTGTFTKSNDFTNSYSFTSSNKFTSSSSFTPSISFTSSKSFTQSNSFTSSNSFTQSAKFTSSNRFTKSNTFEVRPPDNLIVETTKESSKLPMIVGIVAGLVALLAVAIIIIIVRKKKSSIKLEHIEPETVEQENTTVVNSNPLFNEMDNDDPFREDFAGTAL